MLIGNSLPEYIFIRIAVPVFRLITPCAILSCIVVPVFRPKLLSQHQALWPVAVWFSAESLFFVGVYLPLRCYLQQPVEHPPPPTKEERQRLYDRVVENLPDPASYLSQWFLNAPLGDIKRENVKEFYAWSFLNKPYSRASSGEEEELDAYVDRLEEKLECRLEPGRGPAKALRTTFDPVPMQHRPLVWYLIVGVVETFSSIYLLTHNFHFHTSWHFPALLSFPFRLHSLTPRKSPSKHISYWHRPHTSPDHHPILFLHGIGIGTYTHASFLADLSLPTSSTGQIGIIAIDIPQISSRLTTPSPTLSALKAEILLVLATHSYTTITLIAHSYGTALASTLLLDPSFSPRINATILMDPIIFLLHLPAVAYNFTRRPPRAANERMLHYFASQDALVSHTLARRFFWNEVVLFKEDLPRGRRVVVVLSGRDLIVPAGEVWGYLTGTEAGEGDGEWEEGDLRVLWFGGLDHAGIFAARGARRGVAGEGRRLSLMQSVISSG